MAGSAVRSTGSWPSRLFTRPFRGPLPACCEKPRASRLRARRAPHPFKMPSHEKVPMTGMTMALVGGMGVARKTAFLKELPSRRAGSHRALAGLYPAVWICYIMRFICDPFGPGRSPRCSLAENVPIVRIGNVRAERSVRYSPRWESAGCHSPSERLVLLRRSARVG